MFSLFPVLNPQKDQWVSPYNLPVFHNSQVITTQTLIIVRTLVSQQESGQKKVKKGK
jgi:hypothetical protein